MTSKVTILAKFVERANRLLVLTGAGCSTDSGIPDYRDEQGTWKRKQPIRFREFVDHDFARKRYWARSTIGWMQIAQAHPNPAHRALAQLEQSGHVHHLITQNVDGLHQKAGSRKVIDLHGRLDTVQCLGCGARFSREHFQMELLDLNPDWAPLIVSYAPDGDADIEAVDFNAFRVPQCRSCRGILKPDVVFFGENVPKGRVEGAMATLDEAAALLVVGSSLMIWSGYRFARAAVERGLPVAAVNLGKTRADSELQLKIAGRCGEILPRVMKLLDPL
jgi:NAD-dependent SIR2 family protein deacetylase